MAFNRIWKSYIRYVSKLTHFHFLPWPLMISTLALSKQQTFIPDFTFIANFCLVFTFLSLTYAHFVLHSDWHEKPATFFSFYRWRMLSRRIFFSTFFTLLNFAVRLFIFSCRAYILSDISFCNCKKQRNAFFLICALFFPGRRRKNFNFITVPRTTLSAWKCLYGLWNCIYYDLYFACHKRKN